MTNLRNLMLSAAGATGGTTPPGLYAWGYGLDGRLGDGMTTNYSSPVLIDGGDWIDVSGGLDHVLAIKADGTLWAAGDNRRGELGDGTTTQRFSFVQIGSATDWSQVSAGTRKSAGLRGSSLYTWGMQSGIDGSQQSSPVLVPGTWSSVSRGVDVTYGIRTDGTLWGWGSNISGLLGINRTGIADSPALVGSMSENWLMVSAGWYGGHAIRADGTLWGWGSNLRGQVGDGTTLARTSPVQVGALTSWAHVAVNLDESVTAVRTDGTLWGWGKSIIGVIPTTTSSPVQVGSDSNWQLGAPGDAYALLLRDDNELWAAGNGGTPGALGDGDTTARYSPVLVAPPGGLQNVVKISATQSLPRPSSYAIVQP